MQWKCPHCQFPLALADDRLSQPWSLSQCSACNGFALVQAPKNSETSKKPKIISSKRPSPAYLLPQNSPVNQAVSQWIESKNFNQQIQNQKQKLAPQALSEKGSPLQLDQQRVYEESQINPDFNTIANEIQNSLPISISPGPSLPSPLPDLNPNSLHISPSTARKQMTPLLVGIIGALVVASGVYFFKKGQNLWEKARNKTQVTRTSSLSLPVKDRLQVNVAAPQDANSQSLSPGKRQQDRDLPAPTGQNRGQYSGYTLSESAERNRRTGTFLPSSTNKRFPSSGRQPTQLHVVQILDDSIPLRAGPGKSFPVVAQGQIGVNYLIREWDGEWIKIVLERDADKAAKPTAWIESNQIRPVAPTNVAQDSAADIE